MKELDELLTWECKLALALAGVVLVSLAAWVLVPPLVKAVSRALAWSRYKRYRNNYLPHSTCHKPWRENKYVRG